MSDETTAASVTTEAAPKAKTTAKPKAKATAKPSANGSITGVQHRVLKALAAKGAMTRGKIMIAAFKGNSVNMKPILDPLIKSKLVSEKEIDIDGKVETAFLATPAGRKTAKNAPPARTRGEAQHKSLPKVGGTFTKEYKGKTITVKVLADGFQVGSKKYTSLTAAAKGVRGSDNEINGWAFFGLTK